ncbi:MAG: holo-ACP synthase [Gemmatimonadota bacterium]|nr:holo-ACP synthase [Gemmatimonadota bacterium]MDH5195970.1 holo-ACP synthase [Gemmatimonadota bacterium]
MMPLAVGIDLVAVPRIERMLERLGERATARLLTSGEQEYCLGMAFPARHVAARVAAKEAVYKALQGTEDARGIGWREIEVVRDSTGRPSVRLHARAAARLRELGAREVLLSLTHTDDLAAAIAVVV